MISAIRAALFCFGLACLIPAFAALQALNFDVPSLGVTFVACMTFFGLLIGMAVVLRPVPSGDEYLWQHAALSADPVLLIDDNGCVLNRNEAAHNLDDTDNPSETLPGFLSPFLVDARARVFRIEERMQSEPQVETAWATQDGDIEVSATRLGDVKTLWRFRFRSTKQGRQQLPPAAKLVLSIGRSGTILSISQQLETLLGNKPKQIGDILQPTPSGGAGFAQILTETGWKLCFFIAGAVRAGRRDYGLYIHDDAPANEVGTLEDLPFPMLKIAPDGAIVGVNPAMSALVSGSEFAGQKIENILKFAGKPKQSWKKRAGLDGLPKPEFAVMSNGQFDRFVQVTLVQPQGQTDTLAFINDASELKSLEAQFVQSQKMQAIGQLAGGVAHDFNNLLTAISGHCDLLLLRHASDDPDFGDLDQIRQNSNRAASLVGQLLAFSRKQTLQSETLDLERVLSDHTHLLNRLVGEKITLTFNHGVQMKCVRADKRQLEQVIMNLVVNARDALKGDGEITVTTAMRTFAQPVERGRATVPAGEYCVISVADTGCGIPAVKHQRIFEPFYTSKKTGEGTGLGLSTVYGIVKQTGGFIFVESAVGVGTCFEILLPAVSGRPAQTTVTTSQMLMKKKPAKSDGVVLLVEDEEPVRAFASRALRLKGFKVIEAANAEEALDILEDKSLLIDVFVTDVVMPGKDGPTWVSEALSKRPGTRVVFVSGYAEKHTDNMTDNIPNSTFLPKPFSLADLTRTVAQPH